MISSEAWTASVLPDGSSVSVPPNQSRIAQATTAAAAAAAALALHTALVVLGVQVEWRLPPPAARAALVLLRAALSLFLFLTEQPHTYVIPTAPKTTRTGCCPSRSVQSGRPWTCFPPSSCNCCVAGPAYYLSVYLPAYLVWSSFVRTSPASRKPTKPDSNSTFAAVVSCL